MRTHIFRAYDIRGIYPSEINEEFAFKVGKAFALFKGGKICVGGDVRLSTPSLKSKVIEGLKLSGCEVIDLGIISTPMLIFAIRKLKCDGGIMVTASHNPKEYNGFLFYDEEGIGISMERGILKIKELIEKEEFREDEGKIVQRDIYAEYFDFLISKLEKKKIKAKVVVDGGNGVAGLIVPKLFRKLGIEVVELFCEPDGNFPNREPEPTEENLDKLKEMVRKEKANLGFAYDGDVDRVVAVDEKGNLLKPFQLFGILIKSVLEKKKGKIVFDALTSRAIEELVKKLGGIPVKCKVGHVYQQAKLSEANALLAGEISGHYFFREVYGADDVVYASLKLLEFLEKTKKKLSELYADIPSYPYETFRVKTLEEKKFEFIENLKKELKSKYKLDCLDGVKILLEEGWILLRASNTEPKISVAYEAKDEESFAKIKKLVEELVSKIPR